LCLLHLCTQLIITRNAKLPLIYSLQFIVTYTLEFSVFTSRILATYFSTVIIPVSLNNSLQIPHVKSSLHMLTFKSQLNSLPSLLNHFLLPSQETLSVIIPAGLGSSLCSLGEDTTERIVSVVIAQQYFDCCLRNRCSGNVFTEPLPYNGRFYSGSNISAFRRHVTICVRHSVSRNSTI
jgi:hypothetical protein